MRLLVRKLRDLRKHFSCNHQKLNLRVIFLCLNCFSWELASVLRDAKSKFESAGVKLIAIGVGTPDKARILAERVFCFLGLISFIRESND